MKITFFSAVKVSENKSNLLVVNSGMRSGQEKLVFRTVKEHK